MFKMKCDKKGFTMVELLATIVILGLISAIAIPSVMRLINSSKGKSLESNKNTLVMATESYMQSNTSKLPKNIGEEVILKVSDLKNSNFLKEDIKNADNKSCMKDSFVRIHKYAKDKYSYTAYIYCAGDKVPDKIEANKPKIRVVFTDGQNRITTVAQQNVKTAMVNLTYDGNRDDAGNKFGILGYSYIISVQYSDEEEFVEIYNSGSLDAMGKRKFEIKKDITPYIDITKVTNIRVIAEAYNNDGGYIKVTEDSAYQDVTGPVCGKTKGEPGVNEWNKSWRSKTITIACDDKEGSGCVKDSYTKTFTKESEYGVITIEDNAGNTTDCKVRTHLDWTAPTLTITAKKRNADGSCGTNVGSAKATNSSKNVTFSKYTGGYGSDSWLNLANFPYGVCYEVVAEDNVKIGKGTWSENSENLPKVSANINNLTQKSSKNFTKGDNKTTFNLITEGYRKGKYVLKDQALNEVVINVIAPIDRTLPTVPKVGLYKKRSGADVTSSSGLSGYTNNTWLSGHVLSLPSGSTDRISQLDHYEYTTSGATATATNQAGAYRNINAEGTSSIKYRACDKAGNCSAYGSQYTIKLDRTKPSCSNIARLSNSGGASYTSGKWVNVRGIYTAPICSDSMSGCDNSKSRLTWSFSGGSINKSLQTQYTINRQGTNHSTWYVYDQAGNEGVCSSITENLDWTPPSCSNVAKLNNASGANYTNGKWVNKPVYMAASCADTGGSGCAGTYAIVNDRARVNTTHATVSQQGSTTFKWYTHDNAGNVTACSQVTTARVDTTKPTCSITATSKGSSYSSGSWSNQAITMTANCSDSGGSGCTGTKKLSGNGHNKVTMPNYTDGVSGSKTITWYVSDVAGNEGSCSITSNFDSNKPSCSVSKTSINSTSGVSVRVSCSDSTSGVTNCPGNVSGLKSGRTFTISDKAGNTNSCAVSVSGKTEYRIRYCKVAKKCAAAGCAKREGKKFLYDEYESISSSGKCSALTTQVIAGKNNWRVCNWDTGKSICYCKYYEKPCVAYKASCLTCGGCNEWADWQGWSSAYKSGDGICTKSGSRTVYY